MQVKQFCVLTIKSRVPVRSKAVVLLLLIYYLMYFPLFVGVLCLSLFCYALLCVLSSFVIIFTRKRELVAFIVLRMACYRKCFVSLPHGAVGWSAVCDCGMSLSYSFLFFAKMLL